MKTTEIIVNFLNTIAIQVSYSELPDNTFLPGILIDHGRLIVDLKQLAYPGDLLHEAGHIAVTPSTQRPDLSGDVHRCGHGPAEEMAAIAWSWAACRKVGLAAEILFHPDGYKGGSKNYIEAFSSRGGFGYPLLAYWQMCRPDEYPTMEKWLRD